MEKVITSEVVVGYSQCPYKAYLLLCTKKRGTQHEYMQILEKQRQNAQRNYIDNLRQENADVQPYSLANLKGNHQILVNTALEADGLSTKCAVLSKVRTHSAFGHYSYGPTIVVGSHTIKKEHRLELFFVGYVLERVQEKRPVFGYIVGLDGKSHRVKLENGSKTLIPFLEPLGEWVAEETPEPPSLILNKNCPACQFRDLCREKAIQEDNLSLLDGISTQKAINKYEKKGLFTVKQLSYTFKPRKRKKRAKNPPPVLHKPELQALAIREQKIYLQELPELTRQPVELFLDIEGVPDQQFYYLIGLLICENDNSTYHPFWADTPDDEAQIWRQFLEKVNQYPNVPIYHYGSFEPRTLIKLGRRYDTDIEDLINRLVNVNKHIYGKVYFPVYSNRLKELGTFIGVPWTAPNASGLQSLVWRYYWDEIQNIEFKDLPVTYNHDDCKALKTLSDELSRIKHSAGVLSDVDFANDPKRRLSEVGDEIHGQFEKMLKFAHSNYEKKKISFRKDKADSARKNQRPSKKGYQGQRKKQPRATKTVRVPQDDTCPRCGHTIFRQTKKVSQRLIIDLVLTKNGIKKTVTEYKGFQGYCSKCCRYYPPRGISSYAANQLYGHGFKAFAIYQRVSLHMSYSGIAEILEEQFYEKEPVHYISTFLKDLGNYYSETERSIIQHLLKSPFIHVDETAVNIRGSNQYVWVFTDGKHVVFKLTESREAAVVRDFFISYQGILISDFYSGYDSVQCKQQKCWPHLIRDLNNDLRIHPFDTEYENFILEVRNLIIPIMETVQKYGLKKRNLNKFKKPIDNFYKRVIIDKRYKSEVTIKYQGRFTRNRESLFTFLEQDGIPWHNNTAENAIRHFAIQRDMSKSFYESGARAYLVLLGIRQSCRFQGKSFFKFLFSGETDLENFEAHKRRRLT
jgi:predicted RecB family nuclease